ncbi:innexin inx2-like [Penaeus japonicus]|uniref:innexin inx2-like n=1 Tax=Penaeus japonicus TaxID=27405 RepID=UPI001C7115C4|nr:innexin inx2-like [Penaeus japonicus]
MHYCLGVCVFLLAYNIVQGNWFLRETIHCVEAFNGETLVSPQKKNICLSYPYTCKPPESTKFGERECQRRYQLFYRWIHFSFLILSAVYYTPRLLAKGKDHQLQKLLTDLSTREEKYDKPSLEEGTRLALLYFKNHSFVHTSLYARLVLSHAYALVIDMATVFFFDFMLHNGFYGLVYTTYPWNRNPSNFNDSMSQHFPPYAFCTIDKYNLINNARIENYGCHLMLMELYEKVFIVIWFLLAALIVVTVISVFFLLFLWLPPFNRLFLRTCITSTHIQHVKREVLKITGVGDLFALSLMKRHMNERQFLKFLESLVQAHDNHLKEILVDSQQTYVNMC